MVMVLVQTFVYLYNSSIFMAFVYAELCMLQVEWMVVGLASRDSLAMLVFHTEQAIEVCKFVPRCVACFFLLCIKHTLKTKCILQITQQAT